MAIAFYFSFVYGGAMNVYKVKKNLKLFNLLNNGNLMYLFNKIDNKNKKRLMMATGFKCSRT